MRPFYVTVPVCGQRPAVSQPAGIMDAETVTATVVANRDVKMGGL
jgi:hypothetical protein